MVLGGHGRTRGAGPGQEGNVGWAPTETHGVSHLGLGHILGAPIQRRKLQTRGGAKVTVSSNKCPIIGTAQDPWGRREELLRLRPN